MSTDKQLKKLQDARNVQQGRLKAIDGKIAQIDADLVAARESLPEAKDVDQAIASISQMEIDRKGYQEAKEPFKKMIAELDVKIGDYEHALAMEKVNAGFEKALAVAAEAGAKVSLMPYVEQIRAILDEIQPDMIIAQRRRYDGGLSDFHRTKTIRGQLSKRAGDLERAQSLIEDAGRPISQRPR